MSKLSANVMVRMSPEMHAQVKAAAAAEGISMSEWVRRVVRRTLDARVPPS